MLARLLAMHLLLRCACAARSAHRARRRAYCPRGAAPCMRASVSRRGKCAGSRVFSGWQCVSDLAPACSRFAAPRRAAQCGETCDCATCNKACTVRAGARTSSTARGRSWSVKAMRQLTRRLHVNRSAAAPPRRALAARARRARASAPAAACAPTARRRRSERRRHRGRRSACTLQDGGAAPAAQRADAMNIECCARVIQDAAVAMRRRCRAGASL